MEARITEELYLDDGRRAFTSVPDTPGTFRVEGGRTYSFELCRKPISMGEVRFDHWWMNVSSVYGQRNAPARNGDVIVDYFWALCWKHSTVLQEALQESYLLAKLLPYARSTGSRRVFADSIPTKPYRLGKSRQKLINNLDAQLAKCRDQELSLVEFRDQTAALLGPPRYDDDVREVYDQLAGDLLGEGRDVLRERGSIAQDVVRERWQKQMKAVGRHRGNPLKKQSLDILSYECRAAMHRCYSAVWCDLLPHLAKKYGMSGEAAAFHRFWHLDQCGGPDCLPAERFHLFHGHIFALHPGAGLFTLTNTGQALLGDWLLDAGPGPAFQRLLYGLILAIGDYAAYRYDAAYARQKDSTHGTYYEAKAPEAQRHDRHRHGKDSGSHDE